MAENQKYDHIEEEDEEMQEMGEWLRDDLILHMMIAALIESERNQLEGQILGNSGESITTIKNNLYDR